MKLLTLDLEMNKPTNKIIQIGYVITNTKTLEVLHKQSIIINPNEALDPFIIELTGITQQQVDNGVSLQYAYNVMLEDIKKYNTTTLWAQWGIGDSNLLREQLGLTWETFACRQRAIDVKSIYQAYASFGGETTKTGLGKALEKCGLKFAGKEHDAKDDAYNTWIILEHLSLKMIKFDKVVTSVS